MFGNLRLTEILRGPVVSWDAVSKMWKALFVLVALTFLLGAVVTTAASGPVGASTSRHVSVVQTAPAVPSAQICLAREQCTPRSPLNSPGPLPQVVALGFIAASIGMLVRGPRRRRSPADARVLGGIMSALFRPPIAS
jgi:hypothetical protein